MKSPWLVLDSLESKSNAPSLKRVIKVEEEARAKATEWIDRQYKCISFEAGMSDVLEFLEKRPQIKCIIKNIAKGLTMPGVTLTENNQLKLIVKQTPKHHPKTLISNSSYNNNKMAYRLIRGEEKNWEQKCEDSLLIIPYVSELAISI